ncbi:hypothetical protein VNO78_05268 [Psophocarpus tetragonolobus]|uniref:RNase H type-1 domain-containing protein n=1 Tax=Psophocarpus tetragonolobus TaxID=3891 RepID=A0AAN9SQM6_PSOTE
MVVGGKGKVVGWARDRVLVEVQCQQKQKNETAKDIVRTPLFLILPTSGFFLAKKLDYALISHDACMTFPKAFAKTLCRVSQTTTRCYFFMVESMSPMVNALSNSWRPGLRTQPLPMLYTRLGTRAPLGPYEPVILSLLSHLWNVDVRLIPNEANKVAHLLARRGSSLSPRKTSWTIPPHVVLATFELDLSSL